MNCLSTYGMPPFHIGTLNSTRSAAANRSKAARASAHTRPSAPTGVPPPNTVILALAPSAMSGSGASQSPQWSTTAPGWLSA
jgi:hypothetical protein